MLFKGLLVGVVYFEILFGLLGCVVVVIGGSFGIGCGMVIVLSMVGLIVIIVV